MTADFTRLVLGCLEGFLYGLYSSIFAMYLQYHASKKEANYILFYALSVLYFLSVAIFALDLANFMIDRDRTTIVHHLDFTGAILFGCCDFIAQSILIYRCWIVWGQNNRVVVIPSILAFASLAIWIGAVIPHAISQGQEILNTERWGNKLVITSITMSMTVNALVTGLIVFRIFRVFREVTKATSHQKILGVKASGKKLRYIMFVIIESGVALFAIQMTRVAIMPSSMTPANYDTFLFFAFHGINQMLNGIAPTIILVRVSMGLSFHDKTSMVEATDSLRFAPHSNPYSEMGSVSEERRDDDIEVQQSDNMLTEETRDGGAYLAEQ